MELFEGASGYEEVLVAKADVLNIPIGGTMELLPLCNMDCRMCYIRQTKVQMEAEGRMLTCDEWIEIARKAKDAGVLFLLITGGEPLMYPDFRRLYTALTDMGFVITINTNGTLIDESWADFFASRPCRRMNITLYGKDNATYGTLCRNPVGFDQISRAVKLLKERNVPFRFNFTCTPYNVEQLPELFVYARSQGIPLSYSTYVFPPVRKPGDDRQFERLTPEECAKAMVRGIQAANPGILMPQVAKAVLSNLERPIIGWADGKRCRAAVSGFWINWKGELLPCGMFSEPKESLLGQSFTDAWKKMCFAFRKLPLCDSCENCGLRNICSVCFASCETETGSTSGKPEYLCDVTRCYAELLTGFLPETEAEKYRNLLKE